MLVLSHVPEREVEICLQSHEEGGDGEGDRVFESQGWCLSLSLNSHADGGVHAGAHRMTFSTKTSPPLHKKPLKLATVIKVVTKEWD